MPLILRRSLIFIVLLVAGLALYALWYGIKADRYNDTAIPYLEAALPILTSWEYTRLDPLLAPSARQDFANEKVRVAYRSFSRLGQLESMEKPRFVANRFESNSAGEEIEIVDYQITLQFDTGPAVIEIKLVADGRSYHILRFGIRSEQFADTRGSGQ